MSYQGKTAAHHGIANVPLLIYALAERFLRAELIKQNQTILNQVQTIFQ